MRSLLVALTVAGITSPALSQTMTPATITMIRTGWNADSFAVVTAEPIANPSSCPTPDGYISDHTLPGYETYYAAALTAYFARQPATVTVQTRNASRAGR